MRTLPSGTVTLLFTDIEGSTELLQELGQERFNEALVEHRRVLREAFAAHNGTELRTEGDSFFAAFASAREAVEAAAQAQRALTAGPLKVRIGLHTGEPLPVEHEDGYVGVDVHRAARICAAAHGGQVLISRATRDLLDVDVHDLGNHRLKDLSEPLRIYQVGPGQFPPLKSLNSANLPSPATPLIGRLRELDQLTDLIRQQDVRLVTLTGPGGCGKTRLALALGYELIEDFPHGVFFVALAPLAEPTLVEAMIAKALGVNERGGEPLGGLLCEHLSDRELLLVVDNCEHVLEAMSLLSELLAAAPRLTVVATGRERLRLSGEHEFPLGPLRMVEAIELFASRARAVVPDFELSAEREEVAEICHRLDGLPLAIELAAARVGVLSSQALVGKLEHRLPLLTGGARDLPERQQTLRATITWSYELLQKEERQLFARLASFAGGCTLEAAEGVCEADLDGLASLIGKSLVLQTSDRYLMLETIREYAAERLEESTEAAELRSRHAAWFLALAEEAEPELEGAAQEGWLARLGKEHDNFRAALRWALDRGDSNLALRLAGSLSHFWWVRAHWSEGRRWLEEALSQTAAQDPSHRAKALEAAAHLAARQADYWVAETLAAESLALRHELGDTGGCGRALRVLGMAVWASDKERYRALAEESARLSRDAGDLWCLSLALNNLGYLALDLADYERATVLLEEALQLARAQGDQLREAVFLENLALARLEQGKVDDALGHFRYSLRLAQRLGYVHLLVNDVEGIASVAAVAGRFERAARLAGGVELLREEIGGGGVDTAEERLHARTIAMIEQGLDPEDLAAALSAGQAMTTEELVEYAWETIETEVLAD